MDPVDGEIAALAAEEAYRDAAWARIEAELASPPRAAAYAGRWMSDDRESLVVGVTEDVEGVRSWLQRSFPDVPVIVVERRHSRLALAALAERIEAAAGGVDGPLTGIGVDEERNVVEVGLDGLDRADSRELIERFRDEPVEWCDLPPAEAVDGEPR